MNGVIGGFVVMGVILVAILGVVVIDAIQRRRTHHR
jgi:hypothetical protein